MASIRDVAKKAGVGVGTVSRALNGTGYVAEDTKAKILAMAAELDYQPNELARHPLGTCSGTGQESLELWCLIWKIHFSASC